MKKQVADYQWMGKIDCPTGKMQKHDDVVQKHLLALGGTGFECCAVCPGCPGKTEEIQGQLLLRCSRVGPHGGFVTTEQANICKGNKPAPLIWCLRTPQLYQRYQQA